MTPDERRLSKAVTKTILGLLVFAIVIFLLSLLFSCKTHTPRYDKYDKDGLIKSSTPLYLDKTKGKRTKSNQPGKH